jgi:hypothetical protein
MGRPRRSPLPRRAGERGFILIVLMALLAMGGLYFLVSNLTPEAIEARRQAKTEAAFIKARDALIGYALQYRELNPGQVYGYLPLPDLGSSSNANHLANTNCKDQEGCEAYNFSGNGTNITVIGRFPWRMLGTEPLRDGFGECLWYIVSGSHQRNQQISPMNWDTLGQIDIVTTTDTEKLQSLIASPHDRPVAIIFSPGPQLDEQNRGPIGSDVVTECGGNYTPENYLKPQVVALLDNLGSATSASAYFSGNRSVDTVLTALAISTQGKIFNDSSALKKACPVGTNCTLFANNIGLPLTSDMLFGSLRKSSNFRTDINNMLAAMGTCLEKVGIFTPRAISPDLNRGKVPDVAKCSTVEENAAGYFDNYGEQVFAAVADDITACKTSFVVPGNCLDVSIQDTTKNPIITSKKKCHGVLILGGQRGPGQARVSDSDRKTPSKYLEGDNLTSFTNGLVAYSGTQQFALVSNAFPAYHDVVRCIPEAGYSADNPTGAPFLSVQNTALTPYGGQLTGYNSSSGLITLGLEYTAASFPTALQTDLYGCTWQPDTHAFSGGLRSYFKFRINDSGVTTTPLEGFTFAIVDGDYNGINACGAARQHLGYSGNNLDTPYIKPPKIGIEVDLRRNFSGTGFNPSGTNTLTNGRNDPNYTGGHVGIVYWGGEAAIATTIAAGSCTAPRFLSGGTCYLPAEEDDNIHGYPTSISGCRPPPPNPAAPATPTLSSGVYKLDPNLSSVPTNQDFHVRVEITRSATTSGSAPTLPTVRIATTGNIDLAQPGTAIDGVTLVNNDRILVRAQTLASENGVYVWNGANTQPARAVDFDSAKELGGAIISVAEGSQNGGTAWRQSAINPVPDTDTQYWADLRVRVASQSNLDLASPGTAIDNANLASGDRVLVKTQTSAAENGIYIWNGAATPLTRALDANTVAQRSGMIVQVVEGTDARAWWRSDGANWSRQWVRVATQTNINLSTPGSTIDGCTAMAIGDRVLVRTQTDPSKNGIYLWQGATSPMTRSSDADAANELAGAITQVIEGTDMDRAFRQTTFGATETVDVQSAQWSALDPTAAPQFVVEAWILPDSVTDANRIATMKNTSRPMHTLDASFTPHLHDAPTIYQPFRRARIGFTIGQSTSRNDQTVAINNLFTTWLE